MARLARIVVPDVPHHVTQRGNRSQRVFFSDDDKKAYLKLLLEYSKKNKVEIWAYCLMDNHVHVIVVPRDAEGLGRCFKDVHQFYTRRINFREKWRGFLWQGRFSSFPMDERYLFAAVRYVELNPVKAKIVGQPEDYPWSSASAHIFKTQNALLSSFYLQNEITDWKSYLLNTESNVSDKQIEQSLKTGRPLGSTVFIEKLEGLLGMSLKRQKPGPKMIMARN